MREREPVAKTTICWRTTTKAKAEAKALSRVYLCCPYVEKRMKRTLHLLLLRCWLQHARQRWHNTAKLARRIRVCAAHTHAESKGKRTSAPSRRTCFFVVLEVV